MNKPDWQTPLFSHLVNFAKSKPQSFHVPGHQNGQVYKRLRQFMLDERQSYIDALALLSQLDVTELSHTDDLHDPQGIIAIAQQLTAELYGAAHSFFLVGGSTAGNVALILALCEKNDLIIVQRNVHKSIINACKLAGVQVVFLKPELDPDTGLSVIPSLATLKEALHRYPNAKAVSFTNPNYYGISSDLQAYIELTHQYRIPFIVDEAHGAHYGIAPYSPSSSIAAGADAVVHSAHKTLPAITMGAYLHINSKLIDETVILQQLAIIESSSPSYLIMSSLDLARAALQHYGKEGYEKTYRLRKLFIDWIEEHCERMRVKQLSANSNYRQDPYRLLLYDRYRQCSGFQLQQMLELNGVWAEMATSDYVVFIWHMDMDREQLDQLQQAIAKLELELHIEQKVLSQVKPQYIEHIGQHAAEAESRYNKRLYQVKTVSEPVPFRRKSNQRTVTVDLSQAENYICAEQIIPYPPGIPILYEGETITKAHIDEILHYVEAGARFQGSEQVVNRLIHVLAP